MKRIDFDPQSDTLEKNYQKGFLFGYEESFQIAIGVLKFNRALAKLIEKYTAISYNSYHIYKNKCDLNFKRTGVILN